MICEINAERQVARVILSRSNLLGLLHKLDELGDSACTLFRDCDDGWRVIVTSEPDAQHYTDLPRGILHPLTEAYIKRHNDRNPW